MKRYNKRKKPAEVELNLAAMLDMAFQLLTFFILTFHPAPIESEVNLRLPAALPATQLRCPGHESGGHESGGQVPGAKEQDADPLRQLTTLQITVLSQADGSVRQVAVGDAPLRGIAALERKLREIFSDKASPFDQVVVNAGSNLSYGSLMRVVDICSRQKLPTGRPLAKLSFVEARE